MTTNYTIDLCVWLQVVRNTNAKILFYILMPLSSILIDCKISVPSLQNFNFRSIMVMHKSEHADE